MLGRKQSDTLYSTEDIDLLTTIANAAAISIENARLYQESQRGKERLEVIAELSRIINSSPDINKVYGVFADSVKRLIDCDQASINLVDGQNLRVFAFSQDTPTKIEAGEIMPLKGTGTEWVIALKDKTHS